MLNKKLLLIGFLYLGYLIALFQNNQILGDITSPIVTLVIFFYILKGFFLEEKRKYYKISGFLISLGILAWFLCDLAWGISTLILHINPEENMLIVNGYSLMNLFLMISLVITSYMDLKHFNKIQVLLDTILTTICINIMLWVFVFEQNIDKANMLKSDMIAMLALTIDVIVYAWANIWFFTMRDKRAPRYLNVTIAGIVIYVITDFIYYYQYFYASYEPNSLLDGSYVLGFTLIAIGAWLKQSTPIEQQAYITKRYWSGKVKKELLFLLLPILFAIFYSNQTKYLLILVTCIMFYYVFSNYIKSNIFRDELLKKEQEHIVELENKVNERTKEIVRIMNTDVITGLYNRRYFETSLQQMCEELKGEDNVILLYIDQNRYKSIKATYGRQISEELLRKVTNKLSMAIQKEGGLLASYGDDVFVLARKGNISYVYGHSVASRLIQICSKVYHIEGFDIIVTLNIGIACYPIDSKNSEQLIKNADTAMMQARKIGFNKVLEYNEMLGNCMDHKNGIELSLKKVKFDEEFQMYYQPQVQCSDGSLLGFEALIRWKTKQGVFIPPSEFIPITEETGLIIALGYWIMEKTISQLETWNANTTKRYRLAINISVKQLSDREFLPKLLHILNKYHVTPEQIELEITENIQLEENLSIIETLSKIALLGISIAIDDFGTGYSSLYYLKKLPVNRIKIAKELVDHIEQDSYDHSIVIAVVSIAKAKRIKAIAEGVETKEQWQCLKEAGCDEVQGYYFSKPVPANEIEEHWL